MNFKKIAIWGLLSTLIITFLNILGLVIIWITPLQNNCPKSEWAIDLIMGSLIYSILVFLAKLVFKKRTNVLLPLIYFVLSVAMYLIKPFEAQELFHLFNFSYSKIALILYQIINPFVNNLSVWLVMIIFGLFQVGHLFLTDHSVKVRTFYLTKFS